MRFCNSVINYEKHFINGCQLFNYSDDSVDLWESPLISCLALYSLLHPRVAHVLRIITAEQVSLFSSRFGNINVV